MRGLNIVGKWFWLFKILLVALEHTWLHGLAHFLTAPRGSRSLNPWHQVLIEVLLVNVHREELWLIKWPLLRQLNRWVRLWWFDSVLSTSVKPCSRFITEILDDLLHVNRSCFFKKLSISSRLRLTLYELCLRKYFRNGSIMRRCKKSYLISVQRIVKKFAWNTVLNRLRRAFGMVSCVEKFLSTLIFPSI